MLTGFSSLALLGDSRERVSLSGSVLQMGYKHEGGLKSLTPSHPGLWSYSPSSLNPHESG